MMAKAAPKQSAMWVVRRLRRAGHTALFAGGCVRDMLLGRRCSDYDVATDATPQQVKRLFPRVLLIGAKFGVAMVLHRGRKVEVTTFRSDLSYSDGRRPDGVQFATARADARRRDFTINGMFYDPVSDEVLDTVGGRRDLARRIVRTVGRPDQRFGEDYLRMLRAVRFAVRLDFALDPPTAAAIRRHAGKITAISGERIYEELHRMLSIRSAPAALRLMRDLGLAEAILGELFGRTSRWDRALGRVETVARRADFVLALAALLAELPGPTIGKIVRRWGGSTELRQGLRFLAEKLPLWPQAYRIALCDFKRLMAGEHFARLLALWRAQERLETGGETFTRRAVRRASGIGPNRICPPPLVTGEDLKKMGLREGPVLGQILRGLYDAQLNEQLLTRPAALREAERRLRRRRGS